MLPSGIIGGGVGTKIAFCFPQIKNNGGQNVSLFIYLLYDGDVKVDRNGASLTWLPVSLHFVPGGRQNSIAKARFMGKQS